MDKHTRGLRARKRLAQNHSVILEFDVPSYRTGVAQQRSQQEELNRQN